MMKNHECFDVSFLKPAEFFSTGEYLACCFCLKCERVLVLKGHTGLEHMFSKSQNCGILLPFYSTYMCCQYKRLPKKPSSIKSKSSILHKAPATQCLPHICIPNL